MQPLPGSPHLTTAPEQVCVVALRHLPACSVSHMPMGRWLHRSHPPACSARTTHLAASMMPFLWQSYVQPHDSSDKTKCAGAAEPGPLPGLPPRAAAPVRQWGLPGGRGGVGSQVHISPHVWRSQGLTRRWRHLGGSSDPLPPDHWVSSLLRINWHWLFRVVKRCLSRFTDVVCGVTLAVLITHTA